MNDPSALAPLPVLELWKCGHRTFFAEVGNKPLVVYLTRGHPGLLEQSEWIQKNLEFRVVWCDAAYPGVRNDRGRKILGTDLISLQEAMKLRGNTPIGKDTIFILTHMAVPHSTAYHIKRMFPGSRVISQFYDVMSLWCPKDQSRLWNDYSDCKGSNIAEYEALEDILAGRYVDGIVYKDYGAPADVGSWKLMEQAGVPTAWIPSCGTEKNFQAPPNPDVSARFIYIGTICPKSTHGGKTGKSGLFADIMMERIFSDVNQQGFEVHAYLSSLGDEVRREYQGLFPYGGVRLFDGAFLTGLLPRTEGRYKWGFMLYHFPQPAIMELIKATLPTKFFTYMALGVPVVVSEEFEAVCRMVRKYGVGVVIPRSEHGHIRKLLNAQDYKTLTDNIVRVRKQFCHEAYVHSMGALIQRMMKIDPKSTPDAIPWEAADKAYYNAVEAKRKQNGDINERKGAFNDTRRNYPMGLDPEEKCSSAWIAG